MKMAFVSLSARVLLISTGVLSVALLLKVSVPLVMDFSAYQAPLLWSSLASWLRPPYLYVIINCIVIIIAASSRFCHNHGRDDQQRPPPKISSSADHVMPLQPDHDQFEYHHETKMPNAEVQSGFGALESTPEVVYDYDEQQRVRDKNTAEGNGYPDTEIDRDRGEEEWGSSRSSGIPPPKRMDSLEHLPELLSSAEKPLVSARFGHRKPVKASPEGGRALRVSKPRRHETLENTWKMITEGRPMPLTRHLRKSSDTWENHGRQVNVVSPVDPLETFKDRTNNNQPSPPTVSSSSPDAAATTSSGTGRLRKEPSLSQEELNRRVEAFIKKFNDEMRLQREESLNQYKDMISHGSR